MQQKTKVLHQALMQHLQTQINSSYETSGGIIHQEAKKVIDETIKKMIVEYYNHSLLYNSN